MLFSVFFYLTAREIKKTHGRHRRPESNVFSTAMPNPLKKKIDLHVSWL
jgi:hypothetical protein